MPMNHRISAFESSYRGELDLRRKGYWIRCSGSRTRTMHYYCRGHYYVGWCGIRKKWIACTQRATAQSCERSRNDSAPSIVFNCTTPFLARRASFASPRGGMKPASTRNIALCHCRSSGQKNVQFADTRVQFRAHTRACAWTFVVSWQWWMSDFGYLRKFSASAWDEFERNLFLPLS